MDSALGVISQPGFKVRPGWVLAAVMLASLMQVIDVTIAATAIPNMQGNLSASPDQISWVLTSYIISTAIMTPAVGWLSARIGRRRLFMVSLAGFTVASFACGQSSSLEELVMWRLFQGALGAPMMPLSQSTLLDVFPRQRHGFAMGIWSVGLMIGPIIGPALGGYITEVYGWPWIFYINLPLGIVALLGIRAFVPESERQPRPFDFLGFAALGLGVASFQVMLDRGELLDWFSSTEIMLEAGIAVACFYVFIVSALTAKHPFVNLRLFRDRNFAVGIWFVFMFGLLLLTGIALMPLFLQNLLDYPVIVSGNVLVPRGLGAMAAMVVTARFLDRIDGRWLMGIGLILLAYAMWEHAHFTADVDSYTIGWVGVVQGFGLGLVFVPINTLTFVTLSPEHRTEAAGMFNFVRNVGASIGVSIVIGTLIRNTQINHEELVGHITPFNEMIRAPFLPEAWQLSDVAGLLALNNEITRQASTIAFANDFKLLMIVALLNIPILFFFRLPKKDLKTSNIEKAE